MHCTSTCTFVHCRKRICIQHTYTEKNPGTDPVYECKHEPISANVHPVRKQFRFLVIWKTSHATLLFKKLRLNLQLAVFCSLSVLSFKNNPKQRSDVKTVKEQTFRKTFHKRSDIQKESNQNVWVRSRICPLKEFISIWSRRADSEPNRNNLFSTIQITETIPKRFGFVSKTISERWSFRFWHSVISGSFCLMCLYVSPLCRNGIVSSIHFILWNKNKENCSL